MPEPVPGDGEVLVDVEAIGVNFRDVYEREREGYGSDPPAIIGAEAAGTVVGTGERLAWTAIPTSYARAGRGRPRRVRLRCPTGSRASSPPQRSCRA